MNQNQIKWLAAILMLVDHVGAVIEAEPMRIVGRLSFPLFAWVFAQNWQRPGDKKFLINRLLLFGFISQIPHILAFGNLQLNIMFSFAHTAIVFYCIRKFDRKIPILGIGLIAAEILKVEYGWYAVMCPLLMLNLKGKGNRQWWIIWILLNLGCAIAFKSWIQIFATAAPLILITHNPSKDKKPSPLEKRFFYYFYPVHIGTLAALRAIGDSLHLFTKLREFSFLPDRERQNAFVFTFFYNNTLKFTR